MLSRLNINCSFLKICGRNLNENFLFFLRFLCHLNDNTILFLYLVFSTTIYVYFYFASMVDLIASSDLAFKANICAKGSLYCLWNFPRCKELKFKDIQVLDHGKISMNHFTIRKRMKLFSLGSSDLIAVAFSAVS